MTQFNKDIDPSVESGNQLATDINARSDAINSSHKGNTRPSYASAGMFWVGDVSNPWMLYLYDGAVDILIGTVNTTSKLFETGSRSSPVLTTAGTANNYTVSLVPALTAYSEGVRITCKVNVDNTGASSMNIDALGTRNIKRLDGTALVGGELKTSGVYDFVLVGTNLVLLSGLTLDTVDISGKMDLLAGGTEGALMIQGASGEPVDTGITLNNLATADDAVNASCKIVVFTASGTYNKPANLAGIEVIVTGGGEAGGNGSNGSYPNYFQTKGIGGNAGGTAIKMISEDLLAAAETITVGAGGAANGDNGSTSSFGTLCSATGGSYITHGIGVAGDLNLEGGGGGSGTSGGAGYWGGGSSSASPTCYGGGGEGGAAGSGLGAKGAPGVVFIKEYYK